MQISRPVRVAIVGTGGIAENSHVPALQAQGDRVRLVAAVDVDTARLAAFQTRHRIPAGYSSVADLLAAGSPDLVAVCTPPALHVDQVVQCLRAGAWVLVEKPPCLSLAEFDRIQAAERAGGPYCGVVFQHRFGAAARYFGSLIASGALGRPLVAICDTTWYRDRAYYEVPWRGRWETEGGGPTMGHGIHQMDLMLALLGEWREVRAMAGRLDRDVRTEDVSMAMVRFANGALASVVNSVLSPREESRLRFDFTRATVELTHLYGYDNTHWRCTPAPGYEVDWRPPPTDHRSSHADQLALLLDAMDRGERPPVSGLDVRTTLELVTALYRSAFTGQPVRRDELGANDPFYHHLHGGTPGWAPEPTALGEGTQA
ncbi:MAG TPA: Gfo/Idh/MocA family oxidoreductase [Pseudonocardiaceae bacterium]|jgi:predicted dehydrogenase|nr:Gfo/Idh/MocA family oxidoreductase [Pseudonocardiaceae bacterium]